jgi:6-methylsalicylate decarboxylase
LQPAYPRFQHDLDGRRAHRGHDLDDATDHPRDPLRYPDIKIINSHLGGALPMLLERVDDLHVWEYPQTPERPSAAARRIWYDTVGHGYIPALRCAIDAFGADRLLPGTDFLYEAGDVFVRAVDHLSASGISGE